MPGFRNRSTFEIARSIKAFLRLDAGLTRGEVPNPEQQITTQNRKLHRAQNRIQRQAQELERLRKTLVEERQGASNEGIQESLRGACFDLAVRNGGLGGLPDTVRDAVLNLRNEIKIARVSEDSAEHFRALEGKKNLELHLGAGREVKPGWVNIDLAFQTRPEIDTDLHPDTMLIEYDLRRGLPVEEGSCACIYSSHFFEHLEYRHGLRLMRDCYRALRSGGTFRIALPTFKGLFARYLQAGDGSGMSVDQSAGILKELPDLEPGTETMVDWINYGVYQRGEHKYIYDEEKIILLLREIGYSSVVESQYKEGIDPSTQIRRQYSFYVEATK